MGAKGFILMLLLFALVGAGAGYGAAQLVPAEEEEQAPETADLVAPGAGGTGAEAGAGTGRPRQTGGRALGGRRHRDTVGGGRGGTWRTTPRPPRWHAPRYRWLSIPAQIPTGGVLQQLASPAGLRARSGRGHTGCGSAERRAARPARWCRSRAVRSGWRRRTARPNVAVAGRRAGERDQIRCRLRGLPGGRCGGLGGRASGRGGQPGGCRDHRGRRWAGRRRRAWLRWSGGSRDGDRNVVRGRRADVGDGGRFS